MIKWLEYDKGAIFRDKKRDGLLVNFLRDYKTAFGGTINPSCMHCLEKYYNNFINTYTMSIQKDKCKFVLKLKYNGIKCAVTKRPCRNGDLTDIQAIKLIEKHPHGVLLFEEIPQSYYDDLKVVAEIKNEENQNKNKKKRTRKNRE